MNRNSLKVFAAAMRNIGCGRLNRKLIGFSTGGPAGPVRYGDIAEFAAATRDDIFFSCANRGLAPPFALSKYAYPYIQEILIHKELNLNFMRTVHAMQTVFWHGQMREGVFRLLNS